MKRDARAIFQKVIEGTQRGHNYAVDNFGPYVIGIASADRSVALYIEDEKMRLVKINTVTLDSSWSYHKSVDNIIKVIVRHLESKT